MKLSNKKIKYIKRYALKKTPEEIAKNLRISLKDVQKVLKQLERKPQDSSIVTHTIRKDDDTVCKYHLIAVFTICLLCIIIYSNTLNSPFVFDDHPNIKENSYLRTTDIDFKQLYNAGFKSPNSRRPVANISFALNYYFGEYDVLGYHMVNIIIHLINGILVYFLALIIFRQINNVQNRKGSQFFKTSIPLISLFAALIFIVHPIQTQSVTYIVQRMNSMAAMFYLLALLLYINGRLARIRWKQWTLFCVCFLSWIMALGSKEMAATLPLIVLVYEWYFFQDLEIEWLRRNLKFFVGLFVVLGLVVFIYLGENPLDRISIAYANRDFSMLERVLTQFRVVLFYISLLLWPNPSRFNLLHYVTTSHSLIEPATTLLSLLIIIGLLGLAVYLARKQRLISFCILLFFINLVIESSVVGLEMIFEHRLYLPMFSLSLIVSYLLFHFLSKRRLWSIVIAVVIILSLGTATYIRNSVWRDEVTLWKDCVKKSPQLARPHNNLGVALSEQGDLKDAMFHFREALQIKPNYANAHYGMGAALSEQGSIGEAMVHFREALRIKPNYADANNGMGAALKKQGSIEEAMVHFREASRKNPNNAESHNNQGVVLMEQGLLNEAIAHFKKALRIKQNYADALTNLGVALKDQGNLNEAMVHFRKALRIKPNNKDAHINLGLVLASRGNQKEAIVHFQEAIRINPECPDAHHNLGVALRELGSFKEAIRHSRIALRIKSDYAKAYYNLGVALRHQGDLEEAIINFNEAIRLEADYAKAYYSLGIALKAQGQIEEAIDNFRKAVQINPDLIAPHYNLGVALIEYGSLDEAKRHFSEVLRIQPHHKEAHSNIGVAFTHQGRLKEALIHFRETLRIKPDDAVAHGNIGSILARQGNIEEAIVHFREALRIKPDFIDAQNNLQKALAIQNKINFDGN